WFPTLFPYFMRTISYWLHEITFVAFVIGIIYHIYMSTTAMPGTFRAMSRGTVTKDWARWHHARWYREITQASTASDSEPVSLSEPAQETTRATARGTDS